MRRKFFDVLTFLTALLVGAYLCITPNSSMAGPIDTPFLVYSSHNQENYLSIDWLTPEDWRSIVCANRGGTAHFGGKIYNATEGVTGQNITLWTTGFEQLTVELQPGFIPQTPFDQRFGITVNVQVPHDLSQGFYEGKLYAQGDNTNLFEMPLGMALGFPCTNGTLYLDGKDDYAKTPDNPEIDLGNDADESLTIEVWVAFGIFSPTQIIIKQNAYSLYTNIQREGIYEMRCLNFKLWYKGIETFIQSCNSDISGGGLWTPGWHHVAGVYDKAKGEMRLYMDGQLKHNAQIGQVAVNNSDNPLQIGVGLNGLIEEVRLSAEVLYDGSSYPIPKAPFICGVKDRSRWHFDEAEGASVFHDACGYDNILIGYNGAHTEGMPSMPDLLVVPPSHDFGTWPVGSASTTQAFTITNTGTLDLLIGSLTLKGSYATAFIIGNDNCSGHTLAPSEICSIEVTFLANLPGENTGFLSIPSNDPDIPVLELPLSGTGLILGDIDGNGEVNLNDAILVLQVLAGLNPMGIRDNYEASGVDTDKDNRIGLPDLVFILQKLAGLR